MSAQFPSKKLSNYQVSQAISTAFPNTFSRASTHDRTKHIFGLEEITDTPCSSSYVLSTDLEAENRQLRLLVDDQQLRLQEMQNRIEELERQVAQLQKQVDTSAQSHSLESQIGSLSSPQNAAYHGPDTITHFNDFSIGHVITEFKNQAPDVWQLLNNLGNTGRFSEADDQQLAQLRIVSCMSLLLKSRSHKMLGVQLLVSLMLIARATSRKVGTYTCMK